MIKLKQEILDRWLELLTCGTYAQSRKYLIDWIGNYCPLGLLGLAIGLKPAEMAAKASLRRCGVEIDILFEAKIISMNLEKSFKEISEWVKNNVEVETEI